jgi:hypothetical protein
MHVWRKTIGDRTSASFILAKTDDGHSEKAERVLLTKDLKELARIDLGNNPMKTQNSWIQSIQ